MYPSCKYQIPNWCRSSRHHHLSDTFPVHQPYFLHKTYHHERLHCTNCKNCKRLWILRRHLRVTVEVKSHRPVPLKLSHRKLNEKKGNFNWNSRTLEVLPHPATLHIWLTCGESKDRRTVPKVVEIVYGKSVRITATLWSYVNKLYSGCTNTCDAFRSWRFRFSDTSLMVRSSPISRYFNLVNQSINLGRPEKHMF